MIKYPLFFQASSSASSGIASNWSSEASGLDAVTCSIPKEFMGPGSGYSPEDFMAMAVANCFVATFKVFAEKAHLSFIALDAVAKLEINRLPNGTVGVSSISLDITLKGASDQSKAQTLLEETRKNCLMANALKVETRFTMHT